MSAERARPEPLDAAPAPPATGPVPAGIRPRDAWLVLRRAGGCWSRDNAPLMAAGLAFYVMLALSPLLVVLFGIASPFLAPAAVQRRLIAAAVSAAGPQAGELMTEALQSLRSIPTGLLAGGIGLVATLLASSNVVLQVRYALNVVWGVPRGVVTVRAFVFGRFRSLLILVVLALAMLGWVTLDASIAVAGRMLHGALPRAQLLADAAEFMASVALNTVLLAMCYRIVPDAQVGWRDVGFGAVLAAVLFTLGKVLLALYFGWSGNMQIYGAAASLAAVLLWLYVSGLVFLFGAECCAQWSRLRGSRMAVPLIRSAGP
ncbi:MAG TPA: YihY/virulence factor BrkB family protein [Candidatus Eisenbacteria bacterium]|nr:YihY/virulence factor BrkB family protein [Candidatus Eisenbacteria bacterium]